MRKKSKPRRRSPQPAQFSVVDVQVRVVLQLLYRALQAYPIGSKRHNAVLDALRALTRVFGIADALR